MKKYILLLSILTAISVKSIMAQQNFSITVQVSGISEIKGTIYAALTNDRTDFPTVQNPIAAKAISVDSSKLVFEFQNINGGSDYTIVLYQDLNGNEILDMNGEMPGEPFGFSKYGMMGPPTWDACSFLLEENLTVPINLYSF